MSDAIVPVETAAIVKRGPGRPCEYTDAIGDAVCRAMAGGLPIRRFRERDDLPDPDTLYEWAAKVPAFTERFARARKALAEHYAFQGLERLESVETDSRFGGHRVSKARETAGHMRFLASGLDRETWGNGPTVEVKIGEFHLSAFGKLSSPAPADDD